MDNSDYYILTARQPEPGGRMVHVREETVHSPFGSAHFFQGKPYLGKEPIGIDASEVRGLDFVANFCLVPFVSTRLARVFEAVADDVQLIDTTDPDFKLLNTLHLLECIHYEKAKFCQYEAPGENYGKLMFMIELCVRREIVGDIQVFRVRDWPMPILIGPALKPGILGLNSQTAGLHRTRVE